jgi:hypothetical protein
VAASIVALVLLAPVIRLGALFERKFHTHLALAAGKKVMLQPCTNSAGQINGHWRSAATRSADTPIQTANFQPIPLSKGISDRADKDKSVALSQAATKNDWSSG